LITGGSSGIGLGFAQEFLKLGNTVIVCGRNAERLEKVKNINPEIIIRQCDVSIAEQREQLFSWIEKNYPGLNVLINNAGVQLNTDIINALNLKRVNTEIETNLIAPIHLSSLFNHFLSTKKESAIINISSGLAFAPLAFMPVYCATKAALHSYTLSLRHQLKKTSIKVFEIIPPEVDTSLGHDRRDNASQSHGGITVSEFIKDAMVAISGDIYEAAIGRAKGLQIKREELFDTMNQ
jgi:uncharacterized oxidoreductase